MNGKEEDIWIIVEGVVCSVPYSERKTERKKSVNPERRKLMERNEMKEMEPW